jgi:glycosyltransferase involved in cell wall biosynthesis
VAVESSYHGSLLLFRLLQNYPVANLRIIEGNLHTSAPERRLRGVQYQTLAVGHERLLRTRLHKFYSAILSLSGRGRAKQIEALMHNFSPEAVLTVTHGYSWITAAKFAAEHRIPLHLICHDDWPRVANLPVFANRWLDSAFGKVYRQAATRFCVSPYMVRRNFDLYGVSGDVLYPSRDKDTPVFSNSPVRLGLSQSTLRVAFAGTLNTNDYARTLNSIAKALTNSDGVLLVYGPISRDDAISLGLNESNIELRGFVPSSELIFHLRQEADVLLVPMSFAPGDEVAMAVNFPSKLADYTAVGLPLLIIGPENSSAVQWARENSGVALVLNGRAELLLKNALSSLATDGELRERLATKASEVGDRLFSAGIAQELFVRKLCSALP